MIYLTHRERRAIIYALCAGLTIIITATAALGAIGGLTCPPGVFC